MNEIDSGGHSRLHLLDERPDSIPSGAVQSPEPGHQREEGTSGQRPSGHGLASSARRAPAPVGSSSVGSLTVVGGTLFFAATDPVNGRELWKTDGTTAGTVLVKDVNPVGHSSPQELTAVGGTLFFEAYGSVAENRELLSVKRAGQPFGRRMFPVSESEFYPSGSPVVRIAFEVRGGRATVLRVIDNQVVLTARRAG